MAVARLFRAVNGFGPAGHIDVAGTLEGTAFVDQPLFQRHGQRNDLESGSRLIGIVNGLAAPLFELQFAQFFFIGVSLQPFKLRRQTLIVNRARIIQIIIGQRRHRQNRAGFNIHHDAGGTVFDIVFFYRIFQPLFQIVLNGRIDGQHQAVAILRVIILFIFIQHIFATGIFLRHHQASSALQLLFIQRLNAVQTHIVAAYKTNDLAGQGAEGVIAFAVGHQIDALDLLFIDELPHLIRFVLFGLLLDHLVIGFHLIFFFADVLRVYIQNFSQRLCNQILIALIFSNLVGRNENCLCRGGNGQRLPIGIINGAAGSRNGGRAGLLRHRFLLQLLMANNLQIIQPAQKRRKCCYS